MSLDRRQFLITLTGSAGLAAPLSRAWADAYPSRPITLVLPFPPGGITDSVGRVLAKKLTDQMGQPVVVDNRPGASGFVGVQAVKQAPADGYTLFMGHMGTQVMNPALFAKLPYNPNDLVPITGLVATPHWLVVAKDSPIKSLADLIAQSKATPDGLTFASQGVGTGGQLLGEMLKARARISGSHVPYKGSAPALLDVLSNRVGFFFDSVSTSMPYVKDSKLRVLAVATPKRLPLMPEIPTMAELGQPGVDLSFWFGLFARAGAPQPILTKVHDEVVQAMHSPEIREVTVPLALENITGTSADLKARIDADSIRWGKVIKDANIKAD
jgi:tripartite-type tricarboxylate transporter receptor subunit TctC